MGPDIIAELQRLRNEIAHLSFDPAIVAKRLSALGLEVPPEELSQITKLIFELFSGPGSLRVPPVLIQVIEALLEGHQAETVLDPSAGVGSLISTVSAVTNARKALAFTQNQREAELGAIVATGIEWQVGDPIRLAQSLSDHPDVIASVLPFGAVSHDRRAIAVEGAGEVALPRDLGQGILAITSLRLSANGVAFFVVLPSFFFSSDSVLQQFETLGLGIEAALALPAGSFAPYTNVPSYLAIVRRRPSQRMFVAQLSADAGTNKQIIQNLKTGSESPSPELGRFVEPLSFRSIESIRIDEQFERVKRVFGGPSIKLNDLATKITLGRPGDDFAFPKEDNAAFVPLVGASDVVESTDQLKLKPQNYAQVCIDKARSDAAFVARFLNSELGKELREAHKTGVTIPKLNRQTLANLPILVPPLQIQHVVLETDSRIMAEQNTVLGLQNELTELRNQLWSDPKANERIDEQLSIVSRRLSGSLREHVSEGLDQWFETLPFPLASILRAWQATPSQDFKAKHEHLLHFFEATAEFISVILLSGFKTNEALFESHRQTLKASLDKQHLSFRRATFGTWKLVVEYLGKQVRQLLAEGGKKPEDAKNDRSVCGELFADQSLRLPTGLSRKEVAAIVSTTNTMRNNWSGHGGVVGLEEARSRNEQLLEQLQKLRSALGDTWSQTQLIHALHCRPRRGLFENEIALLMGSNSEFLKETRTMSTWLDVEELYLTQKESTGGALRLLPLVKVGPSPESAKNACYFFNRVEREGMRFVSYHFSDRPELVAQDRDDKDVFGNLLDA